MMNATRPPPLPSSFVEQRSKPSMKPPTLAFLLETLLPMSRTPGSLPTESDLASLSPTSQRIAKAAALLDRVITCVSEPSFHLSLGGTAELGVKLDINDLKSNSVYVQCCADIVEAYFLGDNRVFPSGIGGTKLSKFWPMPSCLFSLKNYQPLGTGCCEIMEMDAKSMIIILAAVLIDVHIAQPITYYHSSWKMIHELYLHLESFNGWSDVEDFCSLNESKCRFVLASVGILVARRLYRADGPDRVMTTPNSDNNNKNDEKITIGTKDLLNEIEILTRQQMKLRPSDAAGAFNMGWIALQTPARRKTNPVAAAADSFYWFQKAYQCADGDGDDFISAAARLEAAWCIDCCALGVVGIGSLNGAIVRRDFRTEFANKKKEKKSKKKMSMIVCDIIVCDNVPHGQRVMRYEGQRIDNDVPVTTLQNGERHLIEWWEVLRLWNDAMKYYDNLNDIRFGCWVYGESTGWDQLVLNLHQWTKVQKLNLEMEQYASAPIEPGIPVFRDWGLSVCAYCDKEGAYQVCARCKCRNYCSRDCQIKHWKMIHKKECKRV